MRVIAQLEVFALKSDEEFGHTSAGVLKSVTSKSIDRMGLNNVRFGWPKKERIENDSSIHRRRCSELLLYHTNNPTTTKEATVEIF